MITLSFWYKRVALKEIKKSWMGLIPYLEVALKRLYKQRHIYLPSESFGCISNE